ncbi:DUF1109 domain-containing protein [Nostoc sp. 3335mG]|nr:DUF1109 domain-containing protein [Nostoc sp. 3335mG]
MSNDQLLDSLVGDLKPVRPRRFRSDLLTISAVCIVELALYLLFDAARQDLMPAMQLPSFWWKLGSLGVLTTIGAITAIRSFDPANSPRPGLRMIVSLVAATLVLGWAIDAANTGGAALSDRLNWREGMDCVFAMTALSIPVIVAFGILMRRGAPTDPFGSALAIGVASATWGAFVFVFNCPHDDPLYITVWYAVGCAGIALAGRFLLPLINRW